MTDSDGRGLVPSLTADDLIASAPGIDRFADISILESRGMPGPHLELADVVTLIPLLRTLGVGGTDGVVISQGTDTIEEIAFALDLLLDLSLSVVVTGAMRPPGVLGADGSHNLESSIIVAASGLFRDVGVVVVMNDEVHAATQVQKTHPTSLSAFTSPTGPIGWVQEERASLVVRPRSQATLPLPPIGPTPRIPILTVGIGDDGIVVQALFGQCDGLVVEGMGGGHVPPRMVGPLEELAKVVPVLLTTRTRGGEVLQRTYGFSGSESDLISRGLIPAGRLDSLKARIVLSLLLMSDFPATAIAHHFASWSS